MAIRNQYNVTIDFDVAVNMMNDDIREAIAATGDYYDNPQGFFDAYAAAHLDKFGAPWELDKPNPVY